MLAFCNTHVLISLSPIVDYTIYFTIIIFLKCEGIIENICAASVRRLAMYGLIIYHKSMKNRTLEPNRLCVPVLNTEIGTLLHA